MNSHPVTVGFPGPPSTRALWWLATALSLAVALPGCSGCNPKPGAQAKTAEDLEKQKEIEKPKPDFETVGQLRTQPNDELLAPQRPVKPGHWSTATQELRANNFDFQGELRSATVDANGRPLPLDHTLFQLALSRPATLAKGQTKALESLYFVPTKDAPAPTRMWLSNQLRARTSGRVEEDRGPQPTTSMPAFQYFFVVLSTDPDRYTFLKRLDAVQPPLNELSNERDTVYYRVALPRIENSAPLPSYPLAWTSTAYVLWDDVNPAVLTPAQQTALLDWLHWGGQLLISGPKCLDVLRGSFLDEYLPAEKSQTVELKQSDFEPLDGNWSFGPVASRSLSLVIDDKSPALGVSLSLRPGAEFLAGSGELVAERRVGFGRIALTAFGLSDRNLLKWPGYDGFINGALLRRPPREFRYIEQDQSLRCEWQRFRNLQRDARLVSTLRYFSRDMGHLPGEQTAVDPARSNAGGDASDWHLLGYFPHAESGVAGWNDVNGAATAARTALREAAGISIPKAGFVFQVLAVYLLVLVPANWLFFRLIGRVEWAWLAAPLIAIAGSVAVVRLAQLDIGFARSRSEIAILESQGGYPRAHLTRYSALYTSLSTRYDLNFEDDSAVALPFVVDPNFERRLHDSVTQVTFRRGTQVSLQGFTVQSNSTGMVHSEQMHDLGGAVELAGRDASSWRVSNGSNLTIRDAGVLWRDDTGSVQTAWVGELRAGMSAPLRFEPAGDGRPWCTEWDTSAMTSPEVSGEEGAVSLWRFFELASEQLVLPPGEVRLLGWTDQEPPGMSIQPTASQTVAATFVLVHLQRSRLPAPQRDKNCRAHEAPNDEGKWKTSTLDD